MASRGANTVITRAMRMETKLRSALEATVLEIDDVSHKHAGHAAVKDSNSGETHFDLKIVSPKFEGKNLVNRHRMVYLVLSHELNSGLHALSIVAKTPQEAALK
ncbi:hypothetical protein AB3S75_027581 [Citrus x aurantiifolia]